MQEEDDKQPSEDQGVSSRNRIVALGLIVVGGLMTASEGKSGNAFFGWLGAGMVVVGLVMFVVLLIWSTVARFKKRQ